MLCDYCDGKFIRNHPLAEKSKKTITLAIYFDDLEVANPLGSRRGKHKLGELQVVVDIYMVTHYQECSIGCF